MNKQKFIAGEWVHNLASALVELKKLQAPFLENYWKQNSYPVQRLHNGRDETPFHSDDLFHLYQMALYSKRNGEDTYYKPLLAALDPVRGLLRLHPILARALGRMIGNDDFQVQILGSSSLTTLSSLIGGLMERENELSDGDFTQTLSELNALLESSGNRDANDLLGDLNRGYDVVVFHGLHLEEKLEIGDGFFMFPYEQVRDFIDEDLLKDVAPHEVKFRDWRLTGVVVRPYRWKPVFRDKYSLSGDQTEPPVMIERDVLEFLDLLAISHKVPITYLMSIRECVSRSACSLLGQSHGQGGFSYGSSVLGKHYGFHKIPNIQSDAFDLAKSIFQGRKSPSYYEAAVVIRRLSEALSRNGPFALGDRVVDVALTLELMFKPNGRRTSQQLQEAVSNLLENDEEEIERVKNEIKHFYDVRSAIVHGPVDAKKKRLLAECSRAFENGFDVARRSLFKKLHESFD